MQGLSLLALCSSLCRAGTCPRPYILSTQLAVKRRTTLMDSTIEQGPETVVPSLSQPRLQRNALNLFETIASTLANMAPAEGIFVALGVAVSFMGTVAPWAFLLAMV